MRPLPGNEARIGRQRVADHDALPLMTSSSSSQMSFLIADEATVDSYLEHPSLPRPRDWRKATEPEHVSLSRQDDKDGERPSRNSRPTDRDDESASSSASRASNASPSPASMPSPIHPSISRPLTPIMLGTSCSVSALSSPSSRNSLAGSVISEEDSICDGEGPASQETSSFMMGSGSAPQLVMPSIKMPSRRPFTDTGKRMGRLKVLIAGDTGVGKTSLCKAIVQACEHIVHVDPIVSARSSMEPPRPAASTPGPDRGPRPSASVAEIFASTKPYPDWWADLGECRSSHKRKRMGDAVLERNVCFVDTPGYGAGSSALETIVPCVEYVESHLDRVSSDSLNDAEMLNMLGGDGGFQVDVVLYMINHALKPVDMEFLRRLSPLTNIIPLLAQADKLSAEELGSCKRRIASELEAAEMRLFSFVPPPSQEAPLDLSFPTVPYAVSSASGSDHDMMDASLLMSPDYIQPLVSSELAFLVEQLFSPNGSSWLRHSAVKKYMQWRNNPDPSRLNSLCRPLFPQASASALESSALVGSHASMALAHYHNHRQDGQVRLHVVDWAAELQRSLASERAKYEEVARGERAIWLTERLNECVKNGTLVAVGGPRETGGLRKKRRGSRQGLTPKSSPYQDPLGLVQVVADIKAKGWVALECLGCFSVLGGLAFLLVKDRWRQQPVALADEWALNWGAHA